MNTKTKSTLMTEGPIWKRMILFAIPLFLGNLFQQLYNTADSLIVGNFLGSDALAAVSSSGSLIFLMVSHLVPASSLPDTLAHARKKKYRMPFTQPLLLELWQEFF